MNFWENGIIWNVSTSKWNGKNMERSKKWLLKNASSRFDRLETIVRKTTKQNLSGISGLTALVKSRLPSLFLAFLILWQHFCLRVFQCYQVFYFLESEFCRKNTMITKYKDETTGQHAIDAKWSILPKTRSYTYLEGEKALAKLLISVRQL